MRFLQLLFWFIDRSFGVLLVDFSRPLRVRLFLHPLFNL